jgi:hypothetical protein
MPLSYTKPLQHSAWEKKKLVLRMAAGGLWPDTHLLVLRAYLEMLPLIVPWAHHIMLAHRAAAKSSAKSSQQVAFAMTHLLVLRAYLEMLPRDCVIGTSSSHGIKTGRNWLCVLHTITSFAVHYRVKYTDLPAYLCVFGKPASHHAAAASHTQGCCNEYCVKGTSILSCCSSIAHTGLLQRVVVRLLKHAGQICVFDCVYMVHAVHEITLCAVRTTAMRICVHACWKRAKKGNTSVILLKYAHNDSSKHTHARAHARTHIYMHTHKHTCL